MFKDRRNNKCAQVLLKLLHFHLPLLFLQSLFPNYGQLGLILKKQLTKDTSVLTTNEESKLPYNFKHYIKNSINV